MNILQIFQKQKNQMQNEEFKKPIGKWITEEEDVERIVRSFDPLTKTISEETVIEKQKVKVRYDKTVLDGIFCPDFTHVFHIVDSHKYIIKCRNCIFI